MTSGPTYKNPTFISPHLVPIFYLLSIILNDDFIKKNYYKRAKICDVK
jgi:hypothetical protein